MGYLQNGRCDSAAAACNPFFLSIDRALPGWISRMRSTRQWKGCGKRVSRACCSMLRDCPADSGFTSLTVTLPTLPTSTVDLASIHLLDRLICLTNLTRLPPVSVLEKLHAKHVLPGFNDRSREEREIEASTADITRVFPLSHAEIRIIQAHHHFLWNTRISVAYIP
jgi:hypothetical protein